MLVGMGCDRWRRRDKNELRNFFQKIMSNGLIYGLLVLTVVTLDSERWHFGVGCFDEIARESSQWMGIFSCNYKPVHEAHMVSFIAFQHAERQQHGIESIRRMRSMTDAISRRYAIRPKTHQTNLFPCSSVLVVRVIILKCRCVAVADHRNACLHFQRKS